MFGIKTRRLDRWLGDSSLALHLYRIRELQALYSLFQPELFLKANGIGHGPSGSYLSFCLWIRITFQVVYVITVWGIDGPRIVGFAGLYNVQIGRSLGISLAIFKPEDRRRGYGRRTIELLLESLQANNVVNRV